jgi:hypothetical protein
LKKVGFIDVIAIPQTLSSHYLFSILKSIETIPLMKKIVIIILLLYLSKDTHSQKTAYLLKEPNKFGDFQSQSTLWLLFGFNSFDFKIDYRKWSDILVTKTTGFNVGIVGDLKLQEYIHLRFEPGLLHRNLNYPGFTNEVDSLREVNSTYIHFPLLLKFSALRTGNIRPYLVGGVSATLNLSSNSKS